MPRNDPAKQLKWQGLDPVPGDSGESSGDAPFWEAKSLEEMSATEWEALCDRCGQCCLIKLEDEDTGDIAVTRLACKLLNIGSCCCSNYENRRDHVDDCVKLTPEDARRLNWLPKTCAYRADRGGPPPSVVAPSGFRNARDGARGGDFGQGLGDQREEDPGAPDRGPYRWLDRAQKAALGPVASGGIQG